MKILIIFTLYLISGQVGCSDVIGYPGGIVEIYYKHHNHEAFNEYFCKVTPSECAYVDNQNPWSQDRLSLLHYTEGFLVRYRNLSLQDTGSYLCGETGVWNHTVNLKVNSDPCCLGPKTVAGNLGEIVTISCSYPEEFKTNYKYLYKQDGQYFTEVIRTTETQRDRFSISDDRRSKVLIVNISDVREDDGGVYFCGAAIGTKSVNYNSFSTEIHLQVTGPTTTMTPTTASYRSTLTAPPTTASYKITSTPSRAASYRTTATEKTPVTPDEEHFSSSVIIITVCVCVALLLIGGSALIYKLRYKKTQGTVKH
ncbi:CMRF35-like molecule 8 [Colossoma macropomum]|uniref:CMRF35-like molecule 8 n=1 Tax=Colossoma macropomum TaxID=42526 RepID=UPI001864A145|nr:CMRF35-like molecule 8 [Colossoma macropomum]